MEAADTELGAILVEEIGSLARSEPRLWEGDVRSTLTIIGSEPPRTETNRAIKATKSATGMQNKRPFIGPSVVNMKRDERGSSLR